MSRAPRSILFPLEDRRLIFELKENYNCDHRDHNMQQAARVAEFTAFFLMGSLVGIRQDRHHLILRPTRERKTTSQEGSDDANAFSQGLEELKHKLLAMGGMAEKSCGHCG